MPLVNPVLLFVPNLIGYLRIILAIVSIYFMLSNRYIAVVFYAICRMAIVVDGIVSRSLNQVTRYGVLLAMLIDRCCTLALIMDLCVMYDSWILVLQLLGILEVASHWAHMYNTLLSGEISHKNSDNISDPILRVYYGYTPVLVSLTTGTEVFYVSLYLFYFTGGPVIVIFDYEISFYEIVSWIMLPVFLGRQIVNGAQLLYAIRCIAATDLKQRLQSSKSCTAKILDS